MAFPPWAKGNEKDLASYALAAVGDEIKLATPTADLLSEGNRAKVIRELYEALCAKDIRWARERYHRDLAVQEIRTPNTILNGSGDGTLSRLGALVRGRGAGKGSATARRRARGACARRGVPDDRRRQVGWRRAQA